MQLIRIILPALFIGFLLLTSCNDKEENGLPDTKKPLIPSHIPPSHYTNIPASFNGPIFKLGRMLFYDPILSADSTIHCGSCHFASHAFSDLNLTFSQGIQGRTGQRNSPPVFNMAWNTSFMWDGGVNHIEVMPIAPITHPLEMDQSIAQTLEKLNRNTSYRILFNEAFGIENIEAHHMLKALSAFMAGIVSFNSKYDQVKLGKVSFSEEEESGYALFVQHCSQCHQEPLFTDYSFRNNGLDSIYKDSGRQLITQLAEDHGKFKVPTLRNIALTYPYMHDGRFRTLDRVLEHYTSDIQSSSTLDPSLLKKIALNPAQQKQIIAFLNTLSDYTLLTEKEYAKH